MIKKFIIIVFVVTISEGSLIGFSKEIHKSNYSTIAESQNSKIGEDMADFDSIVYPYKASQRRTSQIKANCNKLKRGMVGVEVIQLLGKPDLVSPYYTTVKRGKPIGEFYFYLLGQDKKYGSQKDRNQKSIAVYFNFEGKLTHAIGTQTPFFRDIQEEVAPRQN